MRAPWRILLEDSQEEASLAVHHLYNQTSGPGGWKVSTCICTWPGSMPCTPDAAEWPELHASIDLANPA